MGWKTWNPLESYLQAVDSASKKLLQTLEDHRLEMESQLQCDLLKTSQYTECDEERLYHRIEHVSRAARAFFDQHRFLVLQCAFNPFLRTFAATKLRQFVRSYQHVEHQVKKVLDVPLTEWKSPDSYRDELGNLVRNNPVTYQMVAQADALPRSMQTRLHQQLCGQLEAVHEENHFPQQQQMG